MILYFSFYFSVKFLKANRIDPNGTPHSASGATLFVYAPLTERRGCMS